MPASYHNHTDWSDGKNTAAEMIAAAAKQGLDGIGISDHWVLHPEGRTPPWSMPPEKLAEYLEHIRSFDDAAAGVEVDWFSASADKIRTALTRAKPDYAIGSIHYIDPEAAPIDGKPMFWKRLTQAEIDNAHRRYWTLVREMAQSGLFLIAGHLDLTKKFNAHPTVPPKQQIGEALDAVARAGMAVELNTSGWHKPCGESYPSRAILEECRKRDIPVMLTADAHVPDDLTRDFDRGAKLLKDIGYTETAELKDGRLSACPL